MARNPDRAVGAIVRDLRSVAMVLEDPDLARLYTYLAGDGDATAQNVIADLEIPRSRAYNSVDRLVEADLAEVTDDVRARRYSAQEVHLTLSTAAGDREYTVTPALIDAVGRQATDDAIDAYVDRHGVAGLATALSYAVARERGDVDHHSMAEDLDIPPSAAKTILQALSPVVDDHDESEALGSSVQSHAVDDPASGE